MHIIPFGQQELVAGRMDERVGMELMAILIAAWEILLEVQRMGGFFLFYFIYNLFQKL